MTFFLYQRFNDHLSSGLLSFRRCKDMTFLTSLKYLLIVVSNNLSNLSQIVQFLVQLSTFCPYKSTPESYHDILSVVQLCYSRQRVTIAPRREMSGNAAIGARKCRTAR